MANERAKELHAHDSGEFVAERTATGSGRPHNEDSVRHCVPEEPLVLARKGILCLVADGMGGHRSGEVASQEAADLVTRYYYGNPARDAIPSLTRAVQIANASIVKRADADRSHAGMGTTLVAAVIRGSEVLVANVGDSRAYHIGPSGIAQITEDHSWVEEQVKAGLLTPEQARTHPQRNLVTRALGSRPEVEIDLYEGVLEADDVLVLCTDGLSGQVQDGEIESIVRLHPPSQSAQSLVDLVKERGGRDDATVLVYRAPANGCGRKQVTKHPSVAKWTWLLVGTAALLALAALLLYLVPVY